MAFFLIYLQTTAWGEIFAKTQFKKGNFELSRLQLAGLGSLVKPSYLDKLTKQNQDFIWAIVFVKIFWESFDRYY